MNIHNGVPYGYCTVKREDDGMLTIVECAPTAIVDREILEEFIALINSQRRVVVAAENLAVACGDGADFDDYTEALEDLIGAVAAL